MSTHCHDHCHAPTGGAVPPGYRRALWVALAVNAAMAVIEIGSGLAAGSVSLLADAVDFFGDAANYGLSLAVLTMAMHWRSRVDHLATIVVHQHCAVLHGREGFGADHACIPVAPGLRVERAQPEMHTDHVRAGYRLLDPRSMSKAFRADPVVVARSSVYDDVHAQRAAQLCQLAADIAVAENGDSPAFELGSGEFVRRQH